MEKQVRLFGIHPNEYKEVKCVCVSVFVCVGVCRGGVSDEKWKRGGREN